MTGVVLSDDPARLDLGAIHGWLASSYWSPGIARDLVARAIAGSHCLGAYAGDTQVGFVRMISDRATFGWLADVWVDASGRGQGLGRRMVRWFCEHPDYADVRRIALVTLDAHGVYAAEDFHPPIRPERYMERLAPGVADLLRAQGA